MSNELRLDIRTEAAPSRERKFGEGDVVPPKFPVSEGWGFRASGLGGVGA